MKYKRYIFPVLMAITMSNVMSVVNTGRIVFPAIIGMILIQTVVSSIASLIFPAGFVGDRLTRKYFPKLGKMGHLLVSSILPSVFFTSILSISGLLKIRGYFIDFWAVYFNSLPLYILYGYVVSIILNLIIDKVLNVFNR